MGDGEIMDDHEIWFKGEYPNTYRDYVEEIMGAKIIFAHSLVAWDAALSWRRSGGLVT